MSWLHIETMSIRKLSGAAFTFATSPGESRPSRSSKDSSLFCPAVGIGAPVSSNQPAPPPCIITHSGRLSVAGEHEDGERREDDAATRREVCSRHAQILDGGCDESVSRS